MLENNDPKIFSALRALGRNPELRAKVIQLCRDIEKHRGLDVANVREEVTGPIVDALFSKYDILQRTLKNGLRFDFYYRSNIARDLVMAPEGELTNLFEPQTTKLLLHLVQGARHVLIGGAYAGDHVIQVARELLGTGQVHAFEPDLEQLKMLEHNVEMNGLGNVILNGTALWSDETTRLKLVGFDALAHAEIVKDPEEGVRTVTIDNYGDRLGVEQFDVLMLDLEGSELEVFKGAHRYLAAPVGRAPDIIFEIHRRYVDWSQGLQNTEIMRFLRNLGYTIYCIRDFQSWVAMDGEPIEIVNPERCHLEGPPHGFNMLASKDPELFKKPFIRICENVSPKLLLHKDPSLHHPLSWSGKRP